MSLKSPRDDPVLPPPVVITPEPTEEPEVAYSHFGFGIEVPSSGLIYSNVLTMTEPINRRTQVSFLAVHATIMEQVIHTPIPCSSDRPLSHYQNCG